MSTLSIDIETYSSVDLTKSGVYAYVNAPDFQILLLAYAFDDEQVEIIEFPEYKELPNRLKTALTDNNDIKTAFNANFERTCLSKAFDIPMPPKQWRCTMVHGLELGLPGSLAKAAEVFGDELKDARGKSLITYFCKPCKPTKTNGGRTRNLPEHDPEKWETFKEYCIQDVVAERAIKKRLSRFPMDENEQYLWQLDQRINDRGVCVDMDFINAVLQIDEIHTTNLIDRAKAITGLGNPKSITQLKTWVEDEIGEEIDSLTKDNVSKLISECDNDDVIEALKTRQELAKTSVSKYQAMARSVCPDGRIRGLLQFYGANRTGRWCLTGDHEVLTETGWVRLDNWNGGKIACWNPLGEVVSFQKSNALSFSYEGDMYEYEDKRISQLSTPEHKMYVKKRYRGEWVTDTVENMQKYRPSIPFTGYRNTNPGMEHHHLRVLVMVQADGHYTPEGNIKMSFMKERKVERCKKLLRAADIMYSLKVYTQNNRPRYTFTIYCRHVPLWLKMFQNKTFGSWLFNESADVFFDELVHWDGYRSAKNSIQYSTCNRHNADMVQAFAHISGRCALMKIKNRSAQHPNWQDAYVVDIWLTPTNCHEIKNKPEKVPFKGAVYCAETTTGFFLVRRNGRVWVTGNSGRCVQVQNLPQNHLADIYTARDTVKTGDYGYLSMMYDNIPSLLSQLIRTALVPDAGKRFIVCDFSAIEARVIAYLANEKWRMDVFNSHGKIYEASAAAMFNVPVDSIKKGDPLRQKGKIAELALGYGGSVGALTSMGALKMGLLEEELKPLVDAWRAANPAITYFWQLTEKAAISAIRDTPCKTTTGISFYKEHGILFIGLPSGRRLAYVKPEIGINKFSSPCVTYMGMNQTTAKWERIDTFGGKLVENIVQAFSRDCLTTAIARLEEVGYTVNFHVHDEVVIEVPKGESSVKEVAEIMCEEIPWAVGLPLRADGYECEFYMKG